MASKKVLLFCMTKNIWLNKKSPPNWAASKSTTALTINARCKPDSKLSFTTSSVSEIREIWKRPAEADITVDSYGFLDLHRRREKQCIHQAIIGCRTLHSPGNILWRLACCLVLKKLQCNQQHASMLAEIYCVRFHLLMDTVRTEEGRDPVTEIKGWGGDETERRPC